MSTNFIVVDVQYFVKDIIKEIGLYRKGNCIGLAFRPPFPLTDLSPSQQMQCNWVTKHIHGMDWKYGDTPYSNLPHVLDLINPPMIYSCDSLLQPSYFTASTSSSSSSSSCSQPSDDEDGFIPVKLPSQSIIYYAKGSEKCKLLEKVFDIPFVDLDKLGCPRAEQLFKLSEDDENKCSSFPTKHNSGKKWHCRGGGVSRQPFACAEINAKLFGDWIQKTFML